MSLYRLYFMDEAGHISGRDEIEAPDDDSAIAAAALQVGERPMELWLLTRLVMRFEASDARSAAE